MDENNTKKSIHAEREERVLAYWQEKDIFKKTLAKDSPMGEYVFYEGPPTANGKPGIHHLEARAFKDILPRYKTMRGYHVRRKAGWDTHGLPVELKIEKDLGLDSKKKIEEYGIAAFNKKCKESVHEYIDLWTKFTERIGYWTDLQDAYYTYTPKYIESVWKVLAHADNKGLLYKDYKVLPWCPRCGTALSSHELGQPDAYVDVKDLSVTAKFKVKPEQKIIDGFVSDDQTYLLAWTTTPWTLPGNVALAVLDYNNPLKETERYVAWKEDGVTVIASARYYAKVKGPEVEDGSAIFGAKDIVGLEYEPLYPYFGQLIAGPEKEKLPNAYKVYAADFVNTEDGTGIVHTAVMYGADDFDLGTKVGLPKFHLVNEEGHFILGTGFLMGRYVKEVDANGKPTLAVDIIDDLKKRNLFFSQENIKHSYPHCWRCKTPLIYYARDSWYIRMSSLREKLVEENRKVNWQPEHIKEGRMGEWLTDAKDWAISRERYWGTPLPIWETEDKSERVVIDSIDEIRSRAKRSGNQYVIVRHGEAESNFSNVCSGDPNYPHHLTETGKEQIRATAEAIKDKKVNIIYCSPFVRARESAKLLAEVLGLSEDHIVIDDRLRELNFGDFHMKPFDEFERYREEVMTSMDVRLPGGESHQDAKNRIGHFLYEIDAQHANETIVILSHGITAEVLPSILDGLSPEASQASIKASYLEKGSYRTFEIVPIPHNEHFELDLHKPYIDEITLLGKGGEVMRRVKEVCDVWLDSGAMPYAQDADHRETNDFSNILYPADFISEAIDQTRGWFYTLLAEGVIMGMGTPYKNVICLGHLLDATGKKMSKSLGNVVDPWEQMDKYGVDALRLWMYSVNQPGDSKNFDEKTVDELVKKVFLILSNCYVMYETYRGETSDYEAAKETALASPSILDQWIIALFHKMHAEGTSALERYDTFRAARFIREFANDLSTWYVRRSRERYKGDDIEDKDRALATTRYILTEFAKYLAPFAPFFAEDLYQNVTEGKQKESVHLETWEAAETISEELDRENLLKRMDEVRALVTLGLEARQKAGIKVRQPLAALHIANTDLTSDFLSLVQEELNVKEIIFDTKLPAGSAKLDETITPELREEGLVRELVRGIQDLRKEKGLTPKDTVAIVIDTNEEGKSLVEKYAEDIKGFVLATSIVFGKNEGKEIKVDMLLLKVTFI